MTVRPLRDDNGEELLGDQVYKYANTQRVAIGAASAQSAAVGADTRLVRVVASVFCYIATGANPTATNGSYALAANVPEIVPLAPGDKVAVIQEGGAGALSIAEVT